MLGFGHVGETLARVLARAKVPFEVLDLNPERVARGREKGVPIVYGDTTSDLVLKHAGVEKARAAIVLLSDPRATRKTLRLCRQLAPQIFLLVRTRYLADIPHLSALGADEVVAEEFETSFEIARRTLGRLGLPLPWIDTETEEIRRAHEEGFGGSPLEGRRQALAGGSRRAAQIVVPVCRRTETRPRTAPAAERSRARAWRGRRRRSASCRSA